MKTAIVMPFFNEKGHIERVVEQVLGLGIPLVLVDDGSTFSIKLPVDKNLVIIRHGVNLGKGAAMKTGAEYAFDAGYEAVIFMDSDGQHSVKNLPRFVDSLKKGGSGIVLGFRELNRKVPFVRRWGNIISSKVVNILFGIKINDPLCGFRALNKENFNKILWESSGYSVELEMLANIAKRRLKFVQIPIETIYHDRDKGVTILDAFAVLLDIIKWRLTP